MGNQQASPSTAASRIDTQFYILRLYVTGRSTNSSRAITNIKRICGAHLAGRCELKIIDLYQQPELARGKQIIAAPTLVRESPLPLKRIIGDLSDEKRVLIGLDLELSR